MVVKGGQVRSFSLGAVIDLAADVPVGEPDNHAVLGCVVLVLVLHNQTLSGIEVSLPLLSRQKGKMRGLLLHLTGFILAWQSRHHWV